MGRRGSPFGRVVFCGSFLNYLFFNDPAPTEIYPLPLHDALPILPATPPARPRPRPLTSLHAASPVRPIQSPKKTPTTTTTNPTPNPKHTQNTPAHYTTTTQTHTTPNNTRAN